MNMNIIQMVACFKFLVSFDWHCVTRVYFTTNTILRTSFHILGMVDEKWYFLRHDYVMTHNIFHVSVVRQVDVIGVKNA